MISYRPCCSCIEWISTLEVGLTEREEWEMYIIWQGSVSFVLCLWFTTASLGRDSEQMAVQGRQACVAAFIFAAVICLTKPHHPPPPPPPYLSPLTSPRPWRQKQWVALFWWDLWERKKEGRKKMATDDGFLHLPLYMSSLGHSLTRDLRWRLWSHHSWGLGAVPGQFCGSCQPSRSDGSALSSGQVSEEVI